MGWRQRLQGFLSGYDRDGYAIVRGALDRAAVLRLGELVRHHLRDRSDVATGVRGSPINLHEAWPDDLAEVAGALRRLIFSEAMFRALRRLDGEDHYTVHQTLIFLKAPGCAVHIDGWGIDTEPQGYASTAWLPLEDLQPAAGLPSVIPWPRGRVLRDAELRKDPAISDDYLQYHDALARHVEVATTITAPLSAGDAFIWGSLTPHLTLPPDGSSRLSLQVLLRPTRLPYRSFRGAGRTDYRRREANARFAYCTDH